ncbi:MAG: heavy metal translocating P-type ATPase [Alphaproteobacteria bacterium]
MSIALEAGALREARERPNPIDPTPYVRNRKDGAHSLELAVTGAHCAGCLRKIETNVGKLAGVTEARLNLSTGRMHVAWQGALSPAAITETLTRLGYPSAPFDPEAVTTQVDREGRKLLACLAIAGFAAGNIMLFSIGLWTAHGDDMGMATRTFLHWASCLIALPTAAYAGRPFYLSAWRALKSGHANMDVPISLAVLLSLGMSIYETIHNGRYAYFDAATSLLFLLLIGRWLDHRLRFRAGEAARSLIALQSAPARRIERDGNVVAVAARDIEPGDRLLVAPGERVLVNSTIKEGSSEFDLSMLTGESAAVALGPGAVVPGGALNLSDRIVATATARAADSLAAELARLVEAGTQSRARFVRIADKAAQLYVPIVHTLAALTFAGWWMLGDVGFRAALMNAVAVLIITCPCALGLAVPAVQIVASGRLFHRGVLVKSGDGLERLAQADTVVFDKTGTLTRGKPQLARGQVLDGSALQQAALLARISRHPLALAISQAAGPGPVSDDAREFPGNGISGTIDGVPAKLGHRAFVTGEADRGGMELWLHIGDAPPRCIQFEDALRADAAQTIRELERLGLRIVMLSGDTEETASHVARELGIDEWLARQTPTEKTSYLAKLAKEGCHVLMIGDGLNDAPSLASAFVSMSPGEAADAAQAAADFVFQGEHLGPIVEAVRVARRARSRVFENFFFAALYNICAIPLAVLGLVTPFIAAIAMSSSSLIVTLNALRLVGGRKVSK